MNRRVRTHGPVVAHFLGFFDFLVTVHSEGVLVERRMVGTWRS